MSFRYFKELKESKTPEEFKEWFDNTATWGLDVYGQKILCAKITNRKAFLRDGTLVEVDKEDQILMLNSEERDRLCRQNDLTEKYFLLTPEHRHTASKIILGLWEEEEEERERLKNAYCSFCGKTKRRVKKLIAAPNGLFICNKCLGECNKVLNAE